jgi:hypothetical protein
LSINEDAKAFNYDLYGPGDFIGYRSILKVDLYEEFAEAKENKAVLKIRKNILLN